MGLSLAGQSRSPVRQANGGRKMRVNLNPPPGYDAGKPNPQTPRRNGDASWQNMNHFDLSCGYT